MIQNSGPAGLLQRHAVVIMHAAGAGAASWHGMQLWIHGEHVAVPRRTTAAISVAVVLALINWLVSCLS
jgi:hypothetical protein